MDAGVEKGDPVQEIVPEEEEQVVDDEPEEDLSEQCEQRGSEGRDASHPHDASSRYPGGEVPKAFVKEYLFITTLPGIEGVIGLDSVLFGVGDEVVQRPKEADVDEEEEGRENRFKGVVAEDSRGKEEVQVDSLYPGLDPVTVGNDQAEDRGEQTPAYPDLSHELGLRDAVEQRLPCLSRSAKKRRC